ncbi:Nucleoporin nup93 [Dermatophagoides pteronyssinus]|uniref:Nucleoporin nup93 n=2 Tax=Dermatophagoides pteronyssinus TaxID=6956 RepID=A0ABQ8J776_DERPT|nr:nuclear pore complex protein Nup93-like [Dermatophagoides pteronyssinus]KAH9418444.1 Nucleoporin nup93 [Dermatophagoides pteronyssinus]
MESMDTADNLDDLLHKAEQLTAIIDGNIEMPRIERNLKQLLEASDQMYTRTTTSSAKDANDVRASVLLGSKGFDLQKVSQQLESLNQMKKPIQIETETDSDIQGFLKKEYENAIVKNIENVRSSTIEISDKFYLNYIQKEWNDQKTRILNALVGPDEIKDMNFDLTIDSLNVRTSPHQQSPQRTKLYFDKTFIDKSSISSMNASEMAFAQEVVKYVDQVVNTSIRTDLTETFCTVARNIIGESLVIDLWSMVSSLLSSNIPEIAQKDPLMRRQNFKLNLHFLNKSCHYLEQKFIQTMQGIVNDPIGQNISSDVIYRLVKDYLNIKTPFYSSNSSFNLGISSKDVWEDGTVDGIPVWCFVFYCLRAGSIDAAIQVAQKISNHSLKNELTNILRDYKVSHDGYLSRKTEEALRLTYQKSVRLSNDVFKKSVYSIFARCAHDEFDPQIFDKVDDFLWIKLKKVSFNDSENEQFLTTSITTSADQFDLCKFKKEIIEELGENYFEAQEQPFLYFRALFLTLQWEAAIEFLFRFDAYRCYALHIALALHEKNLIVPSQHIKLSILSRSPNDPVDIQRLNLAKLISIYTKKFEITNTIDVVYYYYFLHNIHTPSEESLFNSYVSQLVRETKNYDLLLGYISTEGVRVPGAIDKFNQDVSVIITKVAIDLEKDGYFEDAVQLYDLAGNHSKVLSLLNKMLSPLVAQQKNVDSKRNRIEEFAIRIAERYCNQKCNASKELKSTFYLLIDLMTFFDYYHNQQYNEALDTIIKLNIFPLRPSEIDGKVNDFTNYPDEIRRNIPDLLLATMDILCAQYKEIKNSIPKIINKFGFLGDASNKEQLCIELREKAKSLITFAGMVPYRMPGDVNAKLIQLESSMT